MQIRFFIKKRPNFYMEKNADKIFFLLKTDQIFIWKNAYQIFLLKTW